MYDKNPNAIIITQYENRVMCYYNIDDYIIIL